jgi:hypothetical protein
MDYAKPGLEQRFAPIAQQRMQQQQRAIVQQGVRRTVVQ